MQTVHTVASVNAEKDRQRIEHGESSADPDVSVVNKGVQTVTDPDGTTHKEDVTHLGYKTHVRLNAESGMVTSITPTFGDTADNKEMPGLVAHDAKLGIHADTDAGDKAYDDGDLHDMLWTLKKHSALRLKKTRTAKKDSNEQIWLELLASPFYHAGLKVRFRIERKFGEGKAWHRCGRCRYRGVDRYAVQSSLTFMTLNLKRMVLLVTGVRFRPIAKELVEG